MLRPGPSSGRPGHLLPGGEGRIACRASMTGHAMSLASPVIVGLGSFRYEVHEHWESCRKVGASSRSPRSPPTRRTGSYVFNRGEHPVIVFDRDGTSWARGARGCSCGRTASPSGRTTRLLHRRPRPHRPQVHPRRQALLTLGTSGRPSDTGATSIDFRTIRHAGPAVPLPDEPRARPDGELYVTDGYGNARVHSSPPTAACSPPGASRAAARASSTSRTASRSTATAPSSSPTARTAASSSSPPTATSSPSGPTWPGRARSSSTPSDNVYVAELGYRAGMWPGTTAPSPDAPGGRVSVFDRDGNLLARWGGGDNPCARATSSPRTTSGSTRGATSTSPK